MSAAEGPGARGQGSGVRGQETRARDQGPGDEGYERSGYITVGDAAFGVTQGIMRREQTLPPFDYWPNPASAHGSA